MRVAGWGIAILLSAGALLSPGLLRNGMAGEAGSAGSPSPAPAGPDRPAAPVTPQDWANLGRYRTENAALPPSPRDEKRVVFMGDSITDGWGHGDRFFPGKPYVNRGISGQTTPQMLIRFRQDVINLAPRAVVVLAGINDIAGNTGPMTLEMTANNIMSMVDLAKANRIKVVLCSVLPAYDFAWRRGMEPAPKVVGLNAWMKDYAAHNGIVYLDYYSAMADERGGLPSRLSPDGVHPNAAGYAIMAPMVEKAIERALRSR